MIGHLKGDYLLLRNYLKGVEGDIITTVLKAVALDMMKLLRQIRETICFLEFTDRQLVRKLYFCTRLLKNTTC